jgi:hypothetical protein
MVRIRGLFTLLLSIVIFGCATVSSIEPVGERPKEILQNEWNGTWIHKDHSITIKVLNEQQGLLQVAWVEEKEGGLKFESHQVAIRESGEWIFGNVKEKVGAPSHYWALIKKEAGQMIVWTPDPAPFRKLVQTGDLRGKAERGDVILEKLTPDDLKGILSGNKGVCFEWQNPVVFSGSGNRDETRSSKELRKYGTGVY